MELKTRSHTWKATKNCLLDYSMRSVMLDHFGFRARKILWAIRHCSQCVVWENIETQISKRGSLTWSKWRQNEDKQTVQVCNSDSRAMCQKVDWKAGHLNCSPLMMNDERQIENAGAHWRLNYGDWQKQVDKTSFGFSYSGIHGEATIVICCRNSWQDISTETTLMELEHF